MVQIVNLDGNYDTGAEDNNATYGAVTAGEKFLVKYQILIKGEMILAIYSLNDISQVCRQYISNGYKPPEHSVPNNDVLLLRWSPSTCIIESLDGSVRIRPDEGLQLTYTDLRNQASITQEVRVLARDGGVYRLHLHFKSDNFSITKPFNITILDENIYGERRIYDDVAPDVPYVPERYDNDPVESRSNRYLSSIPSSKPNNETELPHSRQKQSQMNNKGQMFVNNEGLGEKTRRKRSDSLPSIHSGELKPGERNIRSFLSKYAVDIYWPVLERAGIITIKDFAMLDEKKLKELGVDTLGDRRKIMQAVENSKSAFANVSFYPEKGYESLKEFLEEINLNRLHHNFKVEKISFEMLISMTDDDLKGIGIADERDRKAIIQAVEKRSDYIRMTPDDPYEIMPDDDAHLYEPAP